MQWKNRIGRVFAVTALCTAAGAAQAQVNQNFDTTAVGTLPAAWSSTSTGAGAVWAVTNARSNSAPNSATTNDVASISSQYLTLPPITAAGTVRLEFFKRFDTEATFDGMTVEVDINGGGFNNVGTAAFSVGAYNQAAISNAWQSPIAGQPAFSGAGLTFTQSVVLVSATAGDSVTFRFNMSSDVSVSGNGVWVDNITTSTASNFGACCNGLAGTCSLNTAAACVGTGFSFLGAGTSCPSSCPGQGACCSTAGACTLTGAAGCTGTNLYQGDGSVCNPYPCPPPANDECTGAVTVTVGTLAASSVGSTTSVSLTPSGCANFLAGSGGSNDVWFRFNPTASSAYEINTCGSGFDTVLSIHSGCPADDSNVLACNDDSTNTGNVACTDSGLRSRIQSVSLTAGTNYFIRVAGYGAADGPTGGISLTIISLVNSGACCNTTTGVCTFSATGASGCAAGTTFQGVNTSCSPSPCPQEACCNATTGACVVAAVGACASGTTGQGNGTSCTVNPCPQPPPPANDECTGAIALTVNTPTAGTLSQATGAAITSCSGSNFDVWYTFTAPVAGSYGVTATLTTGAFIPAVAIFASAPCPVDPNSNDPANDGCQAQGGTGFVKRVGMAQGETILIRVADFGEGTIFSIVVTPVQSGACCNATTGACTTSNTGAAGCASGTTYQGDDSTCAVNPCPQPPPPANDECSAAIAVTLGVQVSSANVNATSSGAGVIATNTGSCTAASLATGTHLDVWYSFVAPATTNYTIDSCGSALDTIISIHSACPADSSNILDCNDDSNAPTGNVACSNSNLSSRIQSVALTAGQTYYIGVAGYNGATGAFNLLVNYVDAASVGSCCVSITCTLTDAANCGGTFTAGGTCTPSPCGGPAGVCCRGATCTTTITSSVACTATLIGGQTAGAAFPASASCNAAVISNAPCCYADYNKVGGITVTDIFNFLTDWFAGSPYANVGGTGAPGPLAVQNIFDFLNNWFAGGC